MTVFPFPLSPLPAGGGSCPRCDRELAVGRLHLPGWRFLLRGRCVHCGHLYLQDLPYGHGLIYPSTLDLTTGETFDESGAAWFADRLRPLWEEPDDDPVRLEVKVCTGAADVVLLNCLDPVYGHSVLKLLNVQRELNGDRAVVVLIPPALAPLVPDGVAEVWTLDERPTRLGRWLRDLDLQLTAQVGRFASCVLSPAFPHPHQSTYDLESLVRVEPARPGTPSVLLSLRDDRVWGTGVHQRKAVETLVKRIRAVYPEAAITAVGVGTLTPLPATIRDERATTPHLRDEERWLALARGADLVIGVHGSNMLLPSGLARATVELVPRSRYGNYLQATLLKSSDAISELIRHRALYGREDLRDVNPQVVADLALSLLANRRRAERLLAGDASGVSIGAATIKPLPASADVLAPEETPRVEHARAQFSRARRYLARGVRAHIPERRPRSLSTQALPVVLTDGLGNRFELETLAEVHDFVRHGGHFEQAELRWAASFAPAGGTAIDVGANVGAFTATLAMAVGPLGRVHAFEPASSARRRLRRTVELNELRNVTVVDRAVADEIRDTELYAYGPGRDSWSALRPRTIDVGGILVTGTAKERVMTTTLDTYCDEQHIDTVDLLKIDVEGAEARVLAGAEKLLAEGRIRALLIEVSDNTLEVFGDSALELMISLEDAGFRTYVADGEELRPFRLSGDHRRLSNVVAIRPQL